MNTVSDLRNNKQEIRTGSFDCCSVAGIGNRRTQELFTSKRYWTDPGTRDHGAACGRSCLLRLMQVLCAKFINKKTPVRTPALLVYEYSPVTKFPPDLLS